MNNSLCKRVRVTTSWPRRIAAILLAIATVVLFCLYPDGAFSLSFEVPFLATLFLPLFLLFALALVVLDIKIEHKLARHMVAILVLLACSLALFYASELLSGRHFWTLLVNNPAAFFYGVAIILAIWLFLFGATGGASWALKITVFIIALFSYVNYFTILFRGTPFIPQDILTLGTAADVASSYSLVFSQEIALSLLLFAAVLLVSSRLKGTLSPQRYFWVLRIGSLAVSVLFFFLTVSKPFIVSQGYEPFYFEQWQSAEQNGAIVNFLANIADATAEAPEGYSSEAVNAIASRYTSDSVDDAEIKPDIVVVLGESWANIVPEGYAQTSEPVIPFISSFAERDDTVYGNLIVSSKGGGTSRQEFQFLTGTNDEYGLHTAPFQFMVSEQTPSIAQSFKQLGYQTVAIHPGTASAWGRDTALPLLGFDTFITEDDFESEDSPYLRTYLRDSVMYDEALNILDSAGEPTFIYAISIHTHGGYAHDDYDSTIEIVEPEGSYEQTEQYLSLMHESDKDFEDFISALEERERPTLVLFFGDHLPNFDNSYDADVLENSDPLWRYKTVYGVWANYELPEISFVNTDYLGLNYLNVLLMQSAGLPLTGYQKFLLEGAALYPVTSIVGYREADGTLISTEEARETKVYQEQAMVQYGFLYDSNALLEEFFTLQE